MKIILNTAFLFIKRKKKYNHKYSQTLVKGDKTVQYKEKDNFIVQDLER